MKHTPGPWAWFQSDHDIYLATPDRGRLFVMGFRRKGMSGAQPTFAVWEGEDRERLGGFMYKGQDLIIKDHPDAKLIAGSPDLLFALTRAEALLMDGPAAEFLDEEEVKKMCREAIENAGGKCRV